MIPIMVLPKDNSRFSMQSKITTKKLKNKTPCIGPMIFTAIAISAIYLSGKPIKSRANKELPSSKAIIFNKDMYDVFMGCSFWFM